MHLNTLSSTGVMNTTELEFYGRAGRFLHRGLITTKLILGETFCNRMIAAFIVRNVAHRITSD